MSQVYQDYCNANYGPEDIPTCERSVEELEAIRAEATAAFPIVSFTCDDCGIRTTCRFVFDPYNTHGHCLAEK